MAADGNGLAYAQGDIIRLRNRVQALEANGAELLRRTERAEAAVETLSARHQPTMARSVEPCCPGHTRGVHPDCPNCVITPIIVCSNRTCRGWPCEDRIALDEAMGVTPSPTPDPATSPSRP